MAGRREGDAGEGSRALEPRERSAGCYGPPVEVSTRARSSGSGGCRERGPRRLLEGAERLLASSRALPLALSEVGLAAAPAADERRQELGRVTRIEALGERLALRERD